MITAAESIERFSVPHSPDLAKGERITWVCGDERHAILSGQLLVGQVVEGDTTRDVVLLDRRQAPQASNLYKQTIAGAFGVGQDLNIALRMARAQRHARGDTDATVLDYITDHLNRNRPEAERDTMPHAAILGSMAAKVARRRGIDLLTHKGCAGQVVASDINYGLAQNSGPKGQDIYKVIRGKYQVNGRPAELERDRYEFIREMITEALADGIIADAETVTATLDDGGEYNGQILDPIGRVAVAKGDHVGEELIVDWREGVAFDVQAALEASNAETGEVWAKYHTSIGDAALLGQTISDTLFTGMDPRDFQDVAFVRNAASSLWLPEQNGVPPQLYAAYV